jgi:hypothetical protein
MVMILEQPDKFRMQILDRYRRAGLVELLSLPPTIYCNSLLALLNRNEPASYLVASL